MRYMIQLICMLLVGCASVESQSPPVPSDPPLEKTVKAFSRAQPASAIVPAPIVHWVFTWDYPTPMPADNIAFDFEGSTNLTDWYLIVTTNQPPVPYDSSQWSESFRVGAHWIVPPD